jgi:hypothetical protein
VRGLTVSYLILRHTMTKKDFEQIAWALSHIKDKASRTQAALAVARKLKATCPRFKRDLFLEACNVPEPSEPSETLRRDEKRGLYNQHEDPCN